MNPAKRNPGLRTLLKRAGIKQSYLARRYGVSETYISLIMNDERKARTLRGKIRSYLQSHISLTKNIAA